MAVFRDYDFLANPLGFHARTLDALQEAVGELGQLHLADSVGIDFHKTGYAPYVSSLFLVRDREHLALLSRKPEEMPYLYQFGNYHPGLYTLECSRSGAGALAALVNMRLFGKMGYRVLIGHVVEMAEHLRARLAPHPFIKVLNDRNVGPVTIFRLYPPGSDAACYERELNDRALAGQVEAINEFNRRIFEHIYSRALRGEGVLLSRTEAYRHAAYPDGPPLMGIKSYIMTRGPTWRPSK